MVSAPITIDQLDSNEYQPYFQPYLDVAGQGGIHQLLADQLDEVRRVFEPMDDELAQTIHPPYSWTLKQVLGHLIDEERIFGCRAHRIGCSENVSLPGFDQDLLVRNTSYDGVAIQSLTEEFSLLRKSNQTLFERMTSEMWTQIGSCDGKKISVRAIAFLLVGHGNHHMNIVTKRLANQ